MTYTVPEEAERAWQDLTTETRRKVFVESGGWNRTWNRGAGSDENRTRVDDVYLRQWTITDFQGSWYGLNDAEKLARLATAAKKAPE